MKEPKRRYVMTSRAAKAEATRARITLSAMELYSEQPIEDFTLDDVAARAGVAVRTILRAFKSKDELVYAALDEMAAGGVFLKPTPAGRCEGGGVGILRHLRIDRRPRHAAAG